MLTLYWRINYLICSKKVRSSVMLQNNQISTGFINSVINLAIQYLLPIKSIIFVDRTSIVSSSDQCGHSPSDRKVYLSDLTMPGIMRPVLLARERLFSTAWGKQLIQPADSSTFTVILGYYAVSFSPSVVGLDLK